MSIQKVLTGGKVPVKIWAEEVEEQAMAQLENTARLPFVFHHVAVMPDVHTGKGATIGSVVATKGAIIPAAVWVDIGCGMTAAKLPGNGGPWLDAAKKFREEVECRIPVGFSGNADNLLAHEDWTGWGEPTVGGMEKALRHKAAMQMCSLGGGNHFIELCRDLKDGRAWVMLHSGSRGAGNILAQQHIERAKGLMKSYFIELPDPDLAYLVEGTKEFEYYMADLEWAQSYAAENRKAMLERVLKACGCATGKDAPVPELVVSCHHNYVAKENHFGANVLVTRKGAVRARTGDLGIIPGSMGAKSFIVRGLGNTDSFCSCSHGAGRKMSRTKARAMFTTADMEAQTEGVECRKDAEVVDEIPGAYKNIEKVMADQSDLVEVVHELKQVACVKG